MRIRLHSDFRDYYDHWFCRSDETPDRVFQRLTTGGMDRREMLAFLEAQGRRVPPHGRVAEVAERMVSKGLDPTAASLIVYLDERAHRGEGKIKLTVAAARERYADCYCSEFIDTRDRPDEARSLRHLQVGAEAWLIEYIGRAGAESEDMEVWASNHAPEVEVRPAGLALRPRNPNAEDAALLAASRLHPLSGGGWDAMPLFAIDYVVNDNDWFAVDLNIAPQIRGTGLDRLVPAEKIYRLIEAAICRDGRR